jgi:nucleoside-diphosphate-sugar epimerase
MGRPLRDSDTAPYGVLMHVAVTGATGFIGRNVVPELLRGGHKVTAVVRPGAAERAVAELGSGVSTVEYDLSGPHGDPYAALGSPDVCVHLAWGSLADFRHFDHVERELPQHLAFLAVLVRTGLPRLVVTGTCLEYGLQSGALHEDLPTNPVTAYGLAKDSLRRALELLQNEASFELVWARLFYVHSESRVRRTLLTQLAEAVERGDASFPMSAGEQLRDYLSADEQAALLAALATAQGNAGVVNVCSGQPISVRRLVEEWLARRNCTIALDLGKYSIPDYEPLAFWGNASRLRHIGVKRDD